MSSADFKFSNQVKQNPTSKGQIDRGLIKEEFSSNIEDLTVSA
jgi:hypothetical protein